VVRIFVVILGEGGRILLLEDLLIKAVRELISSGPRRPFFNSAGQGYNFIAIIN